MNMKQKIYPLLIGLLMIVTMICYYMSSNSYDLSKPQKSYHEWQSPVKCPFCDKNMIRYKEDQKRYAISGIKCACEGWTNWMNQVYAINKGKVSKGDIAK